MHIYIDESGTFSGYNSGSVSAVGALAVLSGQLARIEQKYTRLRKKLPQQDGEVKGRLLSEDDVNAVVELLMRNNVVFEATVFDVGIHTETGVKNYKDGLAAEMTSRLMRFNEQTRPLVRTAIDQINQCSLPLFMQAMTTFDVLGTVIRHVPLYYSQRQPKELGEFEWVVDGKDRQKVIDWEHWWSWYAAGALSTRSRRYPMPSLEGSDYSFFARFKAPQLDDGISGVDLSLLLKNLRFSAKPEIGLELIDVLINAIRRAVTGNLKFEGWRQIPQLMIHRPEHYISLIRLEEASSLPQNPPYAPVFRHFQNGGKNMLSPRFLREAEE